MMAQLYPLKTQVDQIGFTVVAESGQLTLQYDTLPAGGDFSQILLLTLDKADLMLHYHYHDRLERYTPDVVRVRSIQSQDEKPVFPTERTLRQEDQPVGKKKGMKGHIRWLDLAETNLVVGESYVLTIERNIQIDINCEDPRPQFKLKEQWPHYAIAAGGIASVIAGLDFINKKEEAYAKYEDAWRNGETAAQAQPFYDDAKQYETTGHVLTYGGLALIAADAIWMWLRWKQKKEKRDLYDQYCTGQRETSFQLKPLLQLQSTDLSRTKATTGIQFTFQF